MAWIPSESATKTQSSINLGGTAASPSATPSSSYQSIYIGTGTPLLSSAANYLDPAQEGGAGYLSVQGLMESSFLPQDPQQNQNSASGGGGISGVYSLEMTHQPRGVQDLPSICSSSFDKVSAYNLLCSIKFGLSEGVIYLISESFWRRD